jgi:uncharacterized membrane protein (GlpM family)
MGKFGDYMLIFFLTGLTAVTVKALGELEESRLAGVLSTLPIRTAIGLFILAGVGGSAAVRQGMRGTWIGVAAIGLMLMATQFALQHVSTRTAIIAGCLTWLASATAMTLFFRD